MIGCFKRISPYLFYLLLRLSHLHKEAFRVYLAIPLYSQLRQILQTSPHFFFAYDLRHTYVIFVSNIQLQAERSMPLFKFRGSQNVAEPATVASPASQSGASSPLKAFGLGDPIAASDDANVE